MSTINIGPTVHTEDEAVHMVAEDTTNVEEAPRVAMDTTVATTTTVVQIEEVHEEVTVEVEEEIKVFGRRNATSAINLDAGPTSILWKNERKHITNSVSRPSTRQIKRSPHSTTRLSLANMKDWKDWMRTTMRHPRCSQICPSMTTYMRDT
jgi:hypothetical protein